MADKRITRRDFVRDTAIAAGGLAAGAKALGAEKRETDKDAQIKKTRSYNPKMEYRRLGKTGLWVSAICLGGHMKRLDKMHPEWFQRGWLRPHGKEWTGKDNPGFEKYMREHLARCMDLGINYVDACTRGEVLSYSMAVRTRRDKIYFGYSWYEQEIRNRKFRTAKALLASLENGLKKTKLEYVDVWRITMQEQSQRHSKTEIDEMMAALEKARKQGKCRFTGLSSHNRAHIKWMCETYPDTVQVVCTPYTAMTKELPKDSVFETFRKCDVGVFGIKPFGGNSLFKGNSMPGNPHEKEDDRRARLVLRHVLSNPAITAPIPGMISTHQVENAVKAVQERRKLDLKEKAELDRIGREMLANLPPDYQWLKDWQYV